MKKFLLALCLCLLAVTAWAEYLKDPIITSQTAVWTDVRAYKNAATAINALSNGAVLTIVGNQTIGENVELQTGRTINFQGNSTLYIYSNATLTINGAIVGPEQQLLSGAGSVNGTPQNTYVFPAWYQSTLTMNWDADPIGTFGGLTPVYKIADYNATRQEVIHANTLSGNFTVYLPTTPLDDGNQVGFLDLVSNFGTNALRVHGNGALINGEAFFDLDVDDLYTTVTYSATNSSWYFTIQPAAGTLVGFGNAGEYLTTNASGDGYSWNSSADVARESFGVGLSGQFLITNATQDGYTWAYNNATFTDYYVNADLTANASSNYWCNTTDGNFTVTLPATPTDGMEVGIGDIQGSCNSTGLPVILAGNGKGINNSTSWNLDISQFFVKVRYIDAVKEWRFLDVPVYGN